VIEALVEAAPELAYAVVAGALTVAGAAIEVVGVQTFTGGEQPLGLWLLLIGFVALYAGVTLGRERVLPAFQG
jgi:hypothetical protein